MCFLSQHPATLGTRWIIHSVLVVNHVCYVSEPLSLPKDTRDGYLVQTKISRATTNSWSSILRSFLGSAGARANRVVLSERV